MSYKEPKYPIYIVSKGRAKIGTTRKAFDKLKIKYYIVIEEQEYNAYNKAVNHDYCTLLILDQKYKEDYDTFDDLGLTKSTGPGPARNFAWEHSMKNGFKWHWVFDDNVSAFNRLYKNRRIPVGDGTIFRVMEEFCDRYKNIAIAGPNYRFFVPDRKVLPPYMLNWRIYSMLLIRNDIPYRWRGRYNEDTDLSLRVLKDGWVTVQFNAFLGDKSGTQIMSGGNSDEFYFKEGTYNKSKMLYDMHPDVTKVVDMFNRIHHKVDYSPFRFNRLKLRDDIDLSNMSKINDFGMKLIRVND